MLEIKWLYWPLLSLSILSNCWPQVIVRSKKPKSELAITWNWATMKCKNGLRKQGCDTRSDTQQNNLHVIEPRQKCEIPKINAWSTILPTNERTYSRIKMRACNWIPRAAFFRAFEQPLSNVRQLTFFFGWKVTRICLSYLNAQGRILSVRRA